MMLASQPRAQTIPPPIGSSLFVALARHGHLTHLGHSPPAAAAPGSQCVALFEHVSRTPANRTGLNGLHLLRGKILRAVIALAIFVPFTAFRLRQPAEPAYFPIGLPGAVHFIFRS